MRLSIPRNTKVRKEVRRPFPLVPGEREREIILLEN